MNGKWLHLYSAFILVYNVSAAHSHIHTHIRAPKDTSITWTRGDGVEYKYRSQQVMDYTESVNRF